MGIRHLTELRDYLEKNADRPFSRTELRDELKQNYPTILANLDYLVNKEKTVIQIEEKPVKVQWKN